MINCCDDAVGGVAEEVLPFLLYDCLCWEREVICLESCFSFFLSLCCLLLSVALINGSTPPSIELVGDTRYGMVLFLDD